MSKSDYRIGVGASSVLLILVVLSLTALGVLSLSSARADYALTKRHVERAEQYSQAAARVQVRLAEMDAVLAAAPQDEAGYAQAALELAGAALEMGEIRIAFTEPLDDASEIQVIIRLLPAGSDRRFEIVQHALVNTTDWAPGSDYGLYLGDDHGTN